MDRDTLLTSPDFNEAFEIHTDAIALHLGAVIRKKGKPISLYSRKTTDYQQQYTVT